MSGERQETQALAPKARAASVVALLLLSPIIGEVLFGATRITTLFVLIPQIGAWGCGSLIIRELVHRRGRGWPAVLLLGIALAIAEECVIQQTSLAPLVGADVEHPYGRFLGVNWVYFLWALGYESIWIVLLPIRLTELIYPSQRDRSWVGTRGMVIASVVFVVASLVAWYSWTQVLLPRLYPELAHDVPVLAVGIALVAIAALAVAALGTGLARTFERRRAESVPPSWLVGLAAFLLALPWFGLIFLAYGAVPALPWVVPMVAGIILASLSCFLIVPWTWSPDWRDTSRLALIAGALIASMVAGFLIFGVGGAAIVDWIAKLVLNLVAVLLLIRLGQKFRSRTGSR